VAQAGGAGDPFLGEAQQTRQRVTRRERSRRRCWVYRRSRRRRSRGGGSSHSYEL